jgi:hypothetical protein
MCVWSVFTLITLNAKVTFLIADIIMQLNIQFCITETQVEVVAETPTLFEKRKVPAPLERLRVTSTPPLAPGTAQERRPSFEKHKPRRVQSATQAGKRGQDPSLVLTYLKKNIYDDEGMYTCIC